MTNQHDIRGGDLMNPGRWSAASHAASQVTLDRSTAFAVDRISIDGSIAQWTGHDDRALTPDQQQPGPRTRWLRASLSRHMAADWGDVSDDEREANDLDAAAGRKVISVYRLPEELLAGAADSEIWVITEAGCESSKATFPSKY